MTPQRDLIQGYTVQRILLRSLPKPSVTDRLWDFAGPGVLAILVYLIAAVWGWG